METIIKKTDGRWNEKNIPGVYAFITAQKFTHNDCMSPSAWCECEFLFCNCGEKIIHENMKQLDDSNKHWNDFSITVYNACVKHLESKHENDLNMLVLLDMRDSNNIGPGMPILDTMQNSAFLIGQPKG